MVQVSQKNVKTKNKWYVLAKLDENSKHGFTHCESKGVFHETLEQAIKRKDDLEGLRNERVYVLERTCEVIL